MIKYLIIDDEPLAHDVIKTYAESLTHLTLVGQCYNALEALNMLQSKQVDLIFLDIEMPKLKGIDFVKTLSSKPKIIITTAYEEYALEGYELDVVDYLLKPFSFERFLKAVNKLEAKPNNTTQVVHKLEDETIFIKTDSGNHQVKIEDIQYLESLGGYVKIHLTNNSLINHSSLQNFEGILNPDRFVRIHKSFIVALPYISKIVGNMVFVNDKQLPIGRSYKFAFQKKLNS